jgi:hypothetical protein
MINMDEYTKINIYVIMNDTIIIAYSLIYKPNQMDNLMSKQASKSVHIRSIFLSDLIGWCAMFGVVVVVVFIVVVAVVTVVVVVVVAAAAAAAGFVFVVVAIVVVSMMRTREKTGQTCFLARIKGYDTSFMIDFFSFMNNSYSKCTTEEIHTNPQFQ